MSTKGLSVTAARHLIDDICGVHRIPLLVLHDFDKAASASSGPCNATLAVTRFRNDVEVIDLGLRLEDIDGLQTEDAFDKGVATAGRGTCRKTAPPSKRSTFC